MSDVRANSGVPVTGQFAGITTPSACAPIVVDQATGWIYSLKSGDIVTLAGGGGTVQRVAATFGGGIVAISGAPISGTGTLAFSVAGQSGGLVYFSGLSAWASSAALTSNALVIGGGAGSAPSTTTTGTGVLTALGVNIGNAGAVVLFNGSLGTPSSGSLTNATGLPISTGVSGLGTGVSTALAVNVGVSGAFVTLNGALGTPSSGTATNLTGTASGLTAGTVTTNANLTGPITSAGNATAVAAQTGTGSTFVMQASPTLTTPKSSTTIGVGNATPSASGSGVSFPATQSASTDANTLDDYEEGTWTPTDASGASLTFSLADGSYVKVGGMVTVQAVVSYPVTADGSNAAIGSLPFTVASAAKNRAGAVVSSDLTTLQSGRWIENTETLGLETSAGARVLNSAMSTKTVYIGGSFFV